MRVMSILAAFAMLVFSTTAPAGLVGMHLKQHFVDGDNGNGYQNMPGTTTWRLYAEFDNPTDQLNNVGGHVLQGGLGVITALDGFYQDIFSGPLSSDFNPALVAFHPPLEFDSWVTIGGAHAFDSQTLTTQGGVLWNLFEAGSGSVWNNPLIAFWGWWSRPVNDTHAFGQVLPGHPNYHVLIGQFTTFGYGAQYRPWGRLSLNGQSVQVLFNGGAELVPWEAHGIEFGTAHASSGACCFEDSAYGLGCVELPEAQCDALGGNWFGPGTACADEMVECDTYGACCYANADGDQWCEELLEHKCDDLGGYWFGASTLCGGQDVNCDELPEISACCYELDDGDLMCDMLSAEECDAIGGIAYGAGMLCSDPNVECGLGACCYMLGGGTECALTTENDCEEFQASTWHGAGVLCTDLDANCEPLILGACCLDKGDGTFYCAEIIESECFANAGVWYGLGSLCTDPGVDCVPPGCIPSDDSDCAGRPQFLDQDYQRFGPSRVAVQTVSPVMPGDSMVTVFDLSDVGGAPVNAIFPIDRYSDPTWRSDTLGGILGLAIDEYGNIFVSASETWNNDAVGFASSMGAVYRIDTYSGVVTVFADLHVDSTSLGSMTYDCEHGQFFVSNFNDGLIYRIDYASGLTLDTFDHGTPWNNQPGPAALGDRVFGLEVSGGRLYYALWNEDIAHSSAAVHNEIWSVELSAAGMPLVGTAVLEIVVSDFPGEVYSSPVSDIDFGPNHHMYLAERTQVSVDALTAHRARALEFECIEGAWLRTSNTFQVGEYGHVTDSASGGVDAKTELVWASGDSLHASGGPGTYIYGMQGFQVGGGTTLDSYLIDYNDEYIEPDKTQVGDLVVTHKAGGPPSSDCAEYQLLGAVCLDDIPTPPYDFDVVFGVNNIDSAATIVSVTMSPPAGMTLTPSTVSMAVAPLNAYPFGTTLSGAGSGDEVCIDLTCQFNNGVVCTDTVCINLPICQIWVRGDFDRNGLVNIDDLMLLLGWWGTECDGLDNDCDWVDADESGVIDMGDLLIVLKHWTL